MIQITQPAAEPPVKGGPAKPTKASPKWAAVVGDQLVYLPRQVLKARDILHQAGATGKKLVRDLLSPFDVGFTDDAEVDLAEGNVFRLVDDCECHHARRFRPSRSWRSSATTIGK
ncbi:MAG: hypothetical protein QM775_31075 [Pirellulales bacterium]